ncbi:hypothetical protein BD410DRAFT_762738 [Rickenella mellea]|uniref:Cupredoxin n=1 Tax=Rickenella mellea TaxID=50990 RepID=A0A4Y7QIZ6_9AGAM|nr:hypothetical protein BD410DRAFT_762738 [Rickenella mellea]
MLFIAAAALISLAVIPVARGAQFNVTVGGPGVLRYNPQFVNAAPGDQVFFTFMQKNHTVTRSSFENPCSPLPQPDGFDSGFQPVADTDTTGPFPTALFVVPDTNPVWVYCRQANHCQQGMVFAINPGTQFAAFQAAAMALGSSSTAPPPAATASGAPSVVTVTATVTAGADTVTTTYGSYPGSAQPTAVSSNDHAIVVGGPGKLFYSPANITAQPGDTVTFHFMQKNHTTTQSSFAAPCRALAATSTNGQVGFDSGFMPVADNATSFPTYTIQINDTAPVWAYCRQATHCGQGMVFSVNAIESGPNNFEAFQALAKQLNGTGTSTSSGASPSKTSGASPQHLKSGAGALLGFAALVLGGVLL